MSVPSETGRPESTTIDRAGADPAGAATAAGPGVDVEAWSAAPSTAVARYLLLGTVFLPFVFYRGVYFPYVTTRALLFRALVGVAALILVWQLFVREVETGDGRDPLLWALLAWVAAGLLSAFLGPATHHSLFGSMERMWGVSQWAHLFVFYLLVRVYFDEAWWTKFFRATLMVSVAVALYALMELTLAHGHEWLWGEPRVGPVPSGFGSTLDATSYLSAYGLVHLVVAGFVYRRGGVGWRAFAVVAAGLNAVSVLLGGSRALLVGLGVGAAVAGTAWLWATWSARDRELSWWRLGLASGGALLLPAVAWWAGLLPPLAELPVVGQLAELGRGLEVIRRRLLAWEAGLDGFLERPLTGWGVENFHLVFDRFSDPEIYRTAGPFNWDRAHNVLVGALAEAGAVGGAAYAALVAAVAARVGRTWGDAGIGGSRAALFTAGITAYGVYLFFWFGDQNSLFVLLALLAWLGFVTSKAREGGRVIRLGAVRPAGMQWRRWLRGGVAVALLAAAGFLLWRAAATWRAARLLARTTVAREPARAVQLYEEARSLEPPQDRDVATQYASFVGRWGRDAAESLRQGRNRELFQRAVGGAEAAVNRAFARAPSDERLLLSRAEFAVGAYAATGVEEAWTLAEESLEWAIRIAPDRLHYYLRLANYQASTRRRDGARESLERAIGRYSAFSDPYRSRSRLHFFEGRRDSALFDLRKSLWLTSDDRRSEVGSDYPARLADAEATAGRFGRAAGLLADWAAARYVPALWGKLDRPRRRDVLEAVSLGAPPQALQRRVYTIAPGDLHLFVRWFRYARAAGDTAQARLAAKTALRGLSASNRTARFRDEIARLAEAVGAEKAAGAGRADPGGRRAEAGRRRGRWP